MNHLHPTGQGIVMDTATSWSSHLFSDIFEFAPDGLILTDLKTGRVLAANPAACSTHGYARAEFIGQFPKIFIHPDSQAMGPN